MTTRYIYIFEDGEVKQTETEPSPSDIESVKSGILQILKVEFEDFSISYVDDVLCQEVESF